MAVRKGTRLAGHACGPVRRGELSGVRGESGSPRGERPRHLVPGDRRPVGRGEKRRTDGGDGVRLQQPKSLVAVRKGPQLAGAGGRQDQAELPLSLLHGAEGAGGVQRPGHGGALCGHAVASRAEWGSDAGAGDGGEPEVCVVAVLPGPCVEGPGPQPHRKPALRLPGLRRADEGSQPGPTGPGELKGVIAFTNYI